MPTKQWLQVEVGNEIVMHLLLSDLYPTSICLLVHLCHHFMPLLFPNDGLRIAQLQHTTFYNKLKKVEWKYNDNSENGSLCLFYLMKVEG